MCDKYILSPSLSTTFLCGNAGQEDREWGVGSGEWGRGSYVFSPFPTPHSPLPLPPRRHRHPFAIRLYFNDSEVVRFEGRADVVSLFAQNAGDDESAFRFEDLGKFGRERDDHVRCQIGQNQVELLAVIRTEFVDFDFNLIRHAIDGGVFKRDFDGFGVEVEADDARSGVELDGSNGENACARSDIEERPALPVFFEHLKTPARGLVRACAEGHSGVDLDHDAVSVSRLIASPRRADENAPAYGDWLIALLPFGQPILIGDGQARDSAQREFGQANHLQVA